MHYRTPRIGFLEDEDEFLAAMPRLSASRASSVETADLEPAEGPVALVLGAP